jgi:Zn-dependent protease
VTPQDYLDITIFFSCQIVILFFSIVSHEVGHGYMAYKLGDPTAKNMGRLTINPVKHIDPVGSLVFLVTLALTIFKVLPMPIGWAKPVMVDFRYFKNPQKAMALVAVTGPMMNLALAALFLFLFKVAEWVPFIVPDMIALVLIYGVFINMLLALVNLIPIPPLDGSNIVLGFLPWRYTVMAYRVRYVGIVLLLTVVFSLGDERLGGFVRGFYGLFGVNIKM